MRYRILIVVNLA